MHRISPLDAFLHVLCKYIRDRGEMVLSLAGAAGQDRVVVSLYGLWRRHRSWETGYQRFVDVVREVLKDDSAVSRLSEIGVEEIVLDSRDPYIVINVNKIKQNLRC